MIVKAIGMNNMVRKSRVRDIVYNSRKHNLRDEGRKQNLK